MENKINREIQKEEDQLIEEQFLKESAEIEVGLSATARKRNAEESFTESLEKRKEGYDRLIARLRETGKYREEDPREFWNARVEKIRKEFEIRRVQIARIHAYAQITAVTTAVILVLLMTGLLIYADIEKFIVMLKTF